jgi:hypothetical protein
VNGITSPRKHNNADHAIVAKRFEDEVNSLMNEKEERQRAKKRPNNSKGFISKNFVSKDSIKNNNVQ